MVFPVVIWMWELDCEESWAPKNWCFWTVVLEKTLENSLDCKEIQPVHPEGNQSSVFIGRTDAEAETNTLANWCKELTHRKRLWCWERLKAGGEGGNRGRDGWMASLTRWTWVWVNSGSLWMTGRPGVLWFMGSQRVRHDWTELNWWCFWSVVWEKTLESPLDCKEIQLVHPKGDQPCIFIERTDAEAETLILWPLDAKNWLIGKHPDAGKDWRWEEKGMTENEMIGWHHQLNGHEFEQTLEDCEGQRSLESCSLWGLKELDTT